jgi:hypothetical protein
VNTVLDQAFGLQISKEPENTGNFSRANPILKTSMIRLDDPLFVRGRKFRWK